MNKKFSTLLTMGLLATSSLCGSAWAQTAPTINGIELEKVAAPANNAAWRGGPYVLVADEDGTLEGSDLLLQAVVSEDGKTVKYYGENLSAFATGAKLKEITWTFTETPVKDVAGVPNGYYYTLTSAASGKPLTVNQSGDLIEKLENCKLDAANHLYTQFSVLSNDFTSRFLQGLGLYPYAGGAGTPVSLTRAELTSIVGLTGSKLYLYKLKTQELVDQVAVEAMNETMAGEGFNFDFTPKKKLDWANDVLSYSVFRSVEQPKITRNIQA